MTTASSYGAYQICFEPCDARISVEFNGRLVADSSRVMVLRETGLPATYYFPREDVRMDWLRPSEHHTHCPFKGNASYWTLEVAGKCAENAVWSYEDPYDEAAQVRNYVAFYWGRMDAWYRNGQRQAEPAVSDRTANPYLGWLLRDAWQAYEAGQLVESFAGRLVDGKLPLQRFGLLIRTLHPQLFAVSYQWQRDRAGVREIQQSHDLLLRSEYLDSPYAPILQGVGGVRRRLEGEDCQLDFPVLRELRDAGATDYVAMPLLFSDGQINIITLVSDRHGGFTTSELGHIHEILPLLSRLFEVQALKRTAQVLLETYLGGYTGPRVLGGLIRRGDSEDIHAVVWFSDLRDSTSISESMPRVRYLELLNAFFDCMAGAVMEQGGEVLKFVGDAVVAIFPIEEPNEPCPAAAERALAAVRDARTRMAALNRQRRAMGDPAVGYGIALHRGEFTYGNIGTARRLDFTVIGAAANEASRLEGMCRQLGQRILLSQAFAASCRQPLRSLGRHRLRGVEGSQELFTLADAGPG